MADLPEHLFANPVWHSLQTGHRHFSLCSADASACRYPADVAPFAAVAGPTAAAAPTADAFRQLATLLAPGEWVWLIGETRPDVPELTVTGEMYCLQMVAEDAAGFDAPAGGIVRLTDSDSPEMVGLTEVAFPGFFRARTNRMGAYFGIRHEGQLIAMAGERLSVDGDRLGYPEVSGVCTHPEHRGKGLAERLVAAVIHYQQAQGQVSWLHVASENHTARRLYLRLGFRTVREVKLHQVRC